jgi:type VI secretion system secreted protein Hcp
MTVPPMLRRTKTWVLAGVVVAAFAVPAGAAEAPVRACMKKATGAVRLVSATAACAADETLVTWSRTGPTGLKGATGATGPVGPAGQNGQNGLNGQNGKDGTQGPAGATGPQGVAGPAGASAEKTPDGQVGYLRCTGIDGEATAPGYAKSIEILSWSHSIVSPRDAASGQATGKRQHKPMTITKELDKSTPLLFSKLITNGTIPFCVVTFLHKFSNGTTEPYMTITLTNAHVAGVDETKGDTRMADQRHLGEYEEVSFTYQKITWEAIGGITAEDDWEAPVT